MKKSMLVAALVFAVASSGVMAGWHQDSKDDATYYYNTKVGQDCFTIYKVNNGYRVYITFQGVGYQEFKDSIVKVNSGARQNPSDSELSDGQAMTSVTLTHASMFDANGNIKFEVYLADRFASRNPKLSVVVMPPPGKANGNSPNVSVTSANCNMSGVKVVYSKRGVSSSGSQLPPAGTVSVTTGTADLRGSVGAIDILGGLFGDCKIRGNCGKLIAKTRKCVIRPGGAKQKVFQGGSLGDSQIFVGGQIGTISARNGLIGSGGKDAKKRIVSGFVDSANPKSYSTSADIGKIIVKRGWDKPCVIAGSESAINLENTDPTFCNGVIKLFRVNNKGDGACSGQTGGYFTSKSAPRVKGKMKSAVSGNTIYVMYGPIMGKSDLSAFVK